jgi:hypothetical protein
MKKKSYAIILAAFCLLASASYAQKSAAILKGGVNFANISNNDEGGYDDSRMLTGFHAGIIADLNLTEFLAIQPGLLYSSKGIRFENDVQELTFNPRYIELPVNLVFKTPTGQSKFFIGAGPYVAMGIGGKFKAEGLFEFSSDIQYSDDDPLTSDEEGAGAFIVRRFDYGLNAIAGIEASNLVISAGYGLGLAKLQSGSNSSSDQNNKHRVFSLSLGFKF